MDRNESIKRVHAPYNFVSFSNKLIKRYDTIQDLPPHDQIDPQLKTGEIHVSLEAQMPIYVSNGKGNKDKAAEEFFRGADGKYQIPGSSIRGMLRENMQILGMGLVRPGEDLADYQIYFRDMASGRGTLGQKVKDGYIKALDVEMKKIHKPDGKPGTVSIPRNVHAGFLYNEHGEFYIKPSRFYRVSRKNSGMYAFEKNGKIPAASYFDVAFTDDGDWVRSIVPQERMKGEMKTGVLLSTGRPVGKKENALYVIEKDSQEKLLPINKSDIISYKEDLESRRNALKGTYKVTEFWELPKDGESKAVFYIEYNGHIYFGMSLFLRIGYPNKISDGLPDRHKEIAARSDEEIYLDYPYSMMGFATKECSYRSRISVGDFKVTENKPCKETYYVIGGEPKPSYYAGYLKDGNSYMDDKFQLRGYKQYWMRDKIYQPEELANENMGKKIKPLGPGTVFEGIIRYKNLHEDELGLLLWSLILDEGCYQSIGMGKPYGLGRISVKIKGIREMNPSRQYSLKSFSENKKLQTECVDQYIKKYKKFASDKISDSKPQEIEKQSRIKEFMFIHRMSVLPEEEMSYMKLEEFKNEKERQKELREIMNEQNQSKKKEPPKEKKMYGGIDLSSLSWNIRK